SLTGIGMPEYLVLFRKWPEDGGSCAEPIRHYRTDQEAQEDGAQESQVMGLDVWQRYASPVWFDIRRTDVLNARIAREDQDEKHICPLQLEVIRRAVKLWSNPGDVVFSPFGGIGSEPYIALEQGRRAVAVELKPAYYDQMASHCQEIAKDEEQEPTLFDLVGGGVGCPEMGSDGKEGPNT
ncbi:MAG: DNA methyltransferase, partial [Clostridiales bacterium]